MTNSIISSVYQEAVPSLMTELGLKSPMAVPKISKVTLNMGLGAEAINDRKVVENAMEDLKLISGQQPIKTNARKSVASFKLREGFTIGCKVTLRGKMMFDFLDRLLRRLSGKDAVLSPHASSMRKLLLQVGRHDA